MNKNDTTTLIQLGEMMLESGFIIDDTNKLNPKLIPRPTFKDFVPNDKNGFAFKAIKSFVDCSSPHDLMLLYGTDKTSKSRLLELAYHESLVSNGDKSLEFIGLETAPELGLIIDEPSDILILSSIDEWVDDSTQLLKVLNIYTASGNKRRLLVSTDKHPSKLTNIDEKCRRRLSDFLIADVNL
jgi:chromosomal replication initiation ATPase DnaA